jgi:predicted N-formylglutamate amidohydrolase
LSDLLGPGDPPPVEVLNPDGRAPFLMTCDHAGRAVPKALGRLGLDDGVFERHVAWDIGAAAVARRLSAALDAPTVFSAYSRLVIDCNRAPGHRGSIPRESDGVRVPGNAKLSPKDVERRRQGYGLHVHAADHGLPGVLLEIRQNLIADESGQAAWAERLGAILPGALEEAGVRR